MYMKPENIFAQIAEAGEEEQFDLLFKSPNCRIDRIVSSGHSSPKGFWYDQEKIALKSAGTVITAFRTIRYWI